MTINWSDLQLNGMPATLRALEQLDKRLDSLASQHNLLAHQVDQLHPDNLKARIAALETLVSALSARLDEQEYRRRSGR